MTKTGRNSPLYIAIVFAFGLASIGKCLDLRDVQEGSCRSIRNVPTVSNVKPNLLDQLTFIPGGSKYQLYRYARGHPHFSLIREHKFFYEACLYKNVSIDHGDGSTHGFGDQLLVNYNVQRRRNSDESGVINVMTELPGTGIHSGNTVTSKVTLTDSNSYAVLVHCWPELDQKGWSVYTSSYVLKRATRNLIEKHILGMGFDRDNVAFLEYDTCKPDADYEDIEDKEASGNSTT